MPGLDAGRGVRGVELGLVEVEVPGFAVEWGWTWV